MKTRNTFLTNVAIIALAVAFPLVTAVKADSITGSLTTAPAGVNLNLSTAYAFYGVNGSFTPATDPSNIGNFSTLIAVGEYTGTGSDAVYNQTTYNNGTSSATLSPNYSLAQVQGFDAGVATVSITTTLFATNETVSIYVSGYDTAPDFSATVGSATFTSNNVVLPTTADGNGTGEGHTYAVLTITVTGTVGETLTITGTTDRTGVTGGNGYTTIAFNSVTANGAIMSLTPANTTLFDGSNTVLTLAIPQAANASQAVAVTVTNNNPGVVSLPGAVGNVLTVTFSAGATNAQSVVVTGVGAGQANLTYASPGLVAIGSATIYVSVGSLSQITGGDSGEGFAPLPIDVAGVTFDSSSVTIQGVIFTQNQDGQTGEGGIDSTGVFPVGQSFGFGSTPDDTNMATMMSGSTYAFTGNTQYGPPITSPDKYVQYQFTGLTNGQTYQVDIFTVCDAIPRPTLVQVVGATTNAYIVETETSPQDVVFDMTPDTNGDITVEWTFGSGAYTLNSNGNSGCVSGIALTTQPASVPTLGVASSGSSLVLTWSAGSTLLQATNLMGPWTTNVNTSPYTNIPIGPQMFFRARTP